MRIERFLTTAQLAAAIRKDGHVASTKDTGNTFMFITGVGWVQLMPVDGVEGQPLVVASVAVDAAASEVPHRSNIEFGPPSRLIPEGGTPGEALQIDDLGQPELQTLPFNYVPGGVTYPVDFSDGASHPISSRVIPGGAMGPNGFVRAKVIANVITNAARTVTFSTGSATVPSLTSASLSSSANNYALVYDVTLVNANIETQQWYTARLETTQFVTGSGASTAEDFNMVVTPAGTPNIGPDTSADWTLTLAVVASGAVTGTAVVEAVTVEYGFAA